MTNGTVHGTPRRESSNRQTQRSQGQRFNSANRRPPVNHRRRQHYSFRSALVDIVLIAVSLVVFALFHHVIPHKIRVVVPAVTAAPVALTAEVTPEPATEMSAATITGMEAETVAVTAEPDPGDFSERFADKFTTGEILADEDTYRSPNLNITLTKMYQDGSQAYIADIYIKNLSCLNTAFAWDSYGKNIIESTPSMAEKHNAIIAINGDYYGTRSKGLVIRNGVLYRDTLMPDCDVCVIYKDGSMKIFEAGTFNVSEQNVEDIWQAWNFGPGLLDDNGQPKTKFSTHKDISDVNPRSVIGYYEPGHYCFVAVDGRTKVSAGWDFLTLAKFMYNLGCTSAYNLDGGKSSVFMVMGNVYNEPVGGGRKVSDIVMINEGGDSLATVTTY